MDSLPAVMIIIFITQILWVFGLHGAAITSSVWASFAIANASANAAAASQAPTHVFTFGFYYGFLQITGSGMTLRLVIPFVVGPVIIAGLNYLAMSTGLVGLPLWESPGFLPPRFQAFLLTLDWKAAVMAVLNVVLMIVFYYPFFKMMKANELRKEAME